MIDDTDTTSAGSADSDDFDDIAALDFEANIDDETVSRIGSAAARPEHTMPLRLALALCSTSSADLLERLDGPSEAAGTYLEMVETLGRALGQNEAEREMLEAGRTRAMVMAAKAITLGEG